MSVAGGSADKRRLAIPGCLRSGYPGKATLAAIAHPLGFGG